jgi:hypothetical protein
MSGHEDSGHNCEHSFAPLVHGQQRIIFAFCSPQDNAHMKGEGYTNGKLLQVMFW